MAGLHAQTKLTQKLGQRLALAPQLTQSLKILAMNSLELDAYLEECLESNPLLEQEPEISMPEAAESGGEDAESNEDWREQGDDRWEEMYSSSGRSALPDQDTQIEEELSLSASLHEQIDREPMSDQERALAHVLIDSLEDDGYFRSDPHEIAATTDSSAEAVITVLEAVIQELEPAGIGARDLVECLLLQLNDTDGASKLVRRMLLHFSDALFEPDDVLVGLLDCSFDELDQARARMRRLDPFPGHGLRGDNNIYVRPEIIFRRSNRDIEVEVPASAHRSLRISNQWDGHQWAGSDSDFMDNAMQEATWLLDALDQRSETLMKVGICLAKRQRAFLEHGALGLKPLTLQDVAEEVGVHESTISRVTNGKYAETPLGLIEMKRFFSAGLPTRGGGTISVYRVQQRVKAVIESEPVGNPISDQAIADRLKAEGIEVARRTVAKYREQAGLPTSSQRRRNGRARIARNEKGRTSA
ncbi:MAG: RNA polymerase factor sigma-54 [Mariprofundaceae bacterium]|nr:RNA polymerase factor sigma-54 [Mariprofundaceae bacterium]